MINNFTAQQMAAAYQEMAAINRQISQEFAELEDEVIIDFTEQIDDLA